MRIFWTILSIAAIAAASYAIVSQLRGSPQTAGPTFQGAEAGPLPRPPVSHQQVAQSDDPQQPAAAQAAVNHNPAKQLAYKLKPVQAGDTAAALPEPVAPGASQPSEVTDRGASSPAPSPVKLVTNPDGSLLVDGKFKVLGEGTPERPYKVTWDHLVSAQDDYAPKNGRKEIPGRISMLDGKWVEITGYVAFPVMAESQEEALSMMNQWDGCCIGVPPTPYDAIEVRLKKAVEGNARLTTYGTMRGRLKIDPQLVGGWLIGLYAMEDATLTPQSYGGFAP